MNREDQQESIDKVSDEIQDNLEPEKIGCKATHEIDVGHCDDYDNCIGCDHLITKRVSKSDFDNSTKDDVPFF